MMSDMSPTALTAIVGLCVALISLLVIAWYCARTAYKEGEQYGRIDNEFLLQDLREQLAKKISEGEIERHKAAEAMEQQWIRFEAELQPLREDRQHNEYAQAEMERLTQECAEQEQRIESLKQALIKTPSLPAQLTVRDIENIEHMAEKLRSASAAFHATQQFKPAKEANRLGYAGELLADKLRTALQADAAQSEAPGA